MYVEGLFFSAAIFFPVVTVGAEDYFLVCVLQGDVVSVVAVAGEFEKFRDPVAFVVVLQACPQVIGQLRGYDVACDG